MKPDECGKQLLHSLAGYRILTFCGEPMEYRLGDGLYMDGAAYYNLGISDYQCINDNVGADCKD